MGLRSFFKSLFSEDEELDALRAKHNIAGGEVDAKGGGGRPKFEQDIPDFWEEIDNYRMNFFLGGWITRKFRGAARRREEDKKKGEGE